MNVFDLAAAITLDKSEYDKGLDDAENKAKSKSSSIGNALKGIGKGLAVAAGAAAVAVGKLVASSVEAYGNYEQLVGGVDTLFGEETSKKVQQYAENAYKTAGMSANQYMETATSFAASLLQSVEGNADKAADITDMAMQDISDNVNKMGTPMESVVSAYQAFAKQNYTLLDNLKLGYGGTKSEMERLLANAQEITGVKYDINNLSDVYEAIHAIQDELGIVGATKDEAERTIQGSAAAMKAAWQNVLVAMSGGMSSFETSIGALVDSVTAYGQNIIPRIQVALGGVAQLITNLAPVIIEALPGMIESILPPLLDGVGGILDALLGAVLGLAPMLVENLPMVIDSLVDFLVSAAPQIAAAGVQLLVALMNNSPAIIASLAAGIPQIIDGILAAIRAGVPQMIEAGANLLRGLWDGISSMAGWLWDKVSGWASGLWAGIKSFFGIASPSKLFASLGDFMMQGLGKGIEDNAFYATRALDDVADSLANTDFNVSAVEAGANGYGGAGNSYNSNMYIENVTLKDDADIDDFYDGYARYQKRANAGVGG